MGIICSLTFRYMRQNRKRTVAAFIGIMGTLVVITAVHIFASTFLGVIRNKIIAEEGGYHAVFHELTKEQYESLKKSDKVKGTSIDPECIDHEQEEKLCVQAEMKKVSRGMLNTTQAMAEELGMPKLAKEEQWEMANRHKARYNVTYHDELLEYYGINHPDSMGVGMLINITLVILALMGSVFIYNAYAISVFEKLKYLGTLGSIGASKMQKAFVVFWEGILEGAVGIPAGIGVGVLLSKIIIRIMDEYFAFEGGLSADITVGMIFKLVCIGILMVFLACFIPAKKANETSTMDLIVRQYTIEENIQKRTNLLKEHKIFGLAGTLALKNIWVKRKSYWSNGFLLVLTFAILLDGIAAMRGMNGAYALKDERERPPLQLWVELYTKDTEKMREFYDKVSEMPEIKNISLERTLDLQGAFLGEEQIQKDLRNFEIFSTVGYIQSLRGTVDAKSGKKTEGYWINPCIVGLDDDTFSQYVEETGYQIPKGEKYPVLIEDYVFTKNEEDESEKRSILDVQPGEIFSFLYSRYGDMDAYATLGQVSKIDEIKEGEFYCIGTTKAAPPYPHFSGMQEDIDGDQEKNFQAHNLYMSMKDFEQLLNDPAYQDTYGQHPQDSQADYWMEYKIIPTYLKFDIHRTEKNAIKEDKRIEKQIAKIAAEIGLGKGEAQSVWSGSADPDLTENETYCFNSRSIWQREQYLISEDFLLLILGYGVILLIAALSVTNIFQNISMSMRVRKREFSMYQSMGMAAKTLRRMLMIENITYGAIGCLIGIPISFIFLNEVYLEFGKFSEINWVMPWDIIALQAVLSVILVVAPMMHTDSQIKHLNIIEAMRSENT